MQLLKCGLIIYVKILNIESINSSCLPVLNLFKLLNIMKSNELSVYSIASGKNEWKGFNEILNYSKSINPQCYIKTPEYNTGKHDEFIDSIFNIFTYIIKPHLSSCMIQHEKDVELY